ncbi:MAG: cytochrome c biogenesis protein CcsA [Deltaproteobacteria bacterium]|nr:cytochrome c biogenesis protein CcsA [Deltaproteobacteria bacterium]
MTTELLLVAAGLYLAAGLASWMGIALESARSLRAAVVMLAAGAAAHAGAFVGLHLAPRPPPLTDLPAAVSLMALIAVLFVLVLLRRARLAALVALVAPASFVGTFFAALRLPHSEAVPLVGAASSWPHLHILLASTGLALLGVAGVAGCLFLVVDRGLKRHRRVRPRWPSLEALDRVNRVALTAGFLLLTLGVVTGVLWVESESDRIWTGTAHETWSVLAWMVYAALVTARFAGRQRGRRAAVAAIAGFAFLFFAVIGVSLLA